jgi:hypothetical protein
MLVQLEGEREDWLLRQQGLVVVGRLAEGWLRMESLWCLLA